MSALPHEAMPVPKPERNLGMFLEKWGDKIDIPSGRLNLMWRDASTQYEEGLDQHNFDHALDVLWTGMELSDLCEENGIAANRKILTLALLFHDAGLHIDHTIYGYATSEDFSADIMARHAPAYGYSDEEIEGAKTFIKATEAGAELNEPYLLEQKIMVRADLHNVGEDYASQFTPTTLRLLEEEIHKCERTGKRFNAGNFVLISVGILRNYLRNDLRLGEFDTGDWQDAAKSNVTKLAGRLAKEAHSTGKTIVDLGTAAVKEVLRGSD